MDDFWGAVFIIAIAALIWNWKAIFPEDQPPPISCYEVVNIDTNIPVIKINRCTGDGWFLIKVPLEEDKDGKTTSFIYRWYKIEGGYGEPSLVRGR